MRVRSNMSAQKTALYRTLFVYGFVGLFCAPGPTYAQDGIREAHVAGSFYPAEPSELRAIIEKLLTEATVPARVDKPRILICPHAGYPYSGPIAASAFRLIQGQSYDRVVVIGFTHQAPFSGSSVDSRTAYATPLGNIPVDTEAVRFLKESFKTSPDAAHAAIRSLEEAHNTKEHSLEVMLPFLQSALGSFKLVPVIMGSATAADAKTLATALAALATHGDTLFVFSTDLSHYHPYDEARRIDERTLNAILFETPLAVERLFAKGQIEACGRGPILAGLFLSEKLGFPERALINYANSGDTTGRRDSVVGYGAAVFYDRTDIPHIGIAPEAGQALVALARQTLERSIGGNISDGSKVTKAEAPTPEIPDLQKAKGVFVTLWKHGTLRGCIGRIQTHDSLLKSVPIVALDAALRDPRFTPVRSSELQQLRVEVSVLTEPKPLPNLAQLIPGRDGVVLELGEHRGVFLPSVWESSGWTRLEFLQELASQKAGLAADDWQRAKLFVFGDQVFVEDEPAAPPEPPTAQ